MVACIKTVRLFNVRFERSCKNNANHLVGLLIYFFKIHLQQKKN